MMKLDTTPALYSPAKAEEIAAAMMAAEEDGWTYRADHDPKGTGYSRVEVLDEDGEHIGYI